MTTFINQRKGETQLLENELKQDWTREEICAACGFTVEWFHNLKMLAKFHQQTILVVALYLHRRTILPFIEEWREVKASKSPQP